MLLSPFETNIVDCTCRFIDCVNVVELGRASDGVYAWIQANTSLRRNELENYCHTGC